MPRPLDDVVVVNLTQIYNGPYATFLLASAGAEVIKVEPLGGEHLRQRRGNKGAALPFAMLNGGKESITLNLKHERGRALLLDLVRRADVLVENFAPGVMDRLGLSWDVLREANPRLIYAASTGYGSDGPYRDYPAMDLAVQAFAGIIAITGHPGESPVKAGPALCDFMTGMHLYGAVLTGLLQRAKTNEGCAVEVSMLEASYPSLASNLGSFYGLGGVNPPRTGNRHGGMSIAPYNVYPTADGHIAIVNNNDAHWRAMCKAFDSPQTADDPCFCTLPERVRNMDALDTLISGWTGRLSKQEAFERLTAARVPSAPVRGLDEVVNDPHLHARGALQWIDHPEYGRIVVQTTPIRFRGEKPAVPHCSPALGSDTASVLSRHLGLSQDALSLLRQDGVI